MNVSFGKIRRVARASTLALAFLLGFSNAEAGQDCEQHTLTLERLDDSLVLAQKTRRALDASGAKVALLARAGQNLDDYGLRYSHAGWAYKHDGEWLVVHKLNQCGTAVSAIYRQGLGEFFLDDLYRYEAAYVIPSPEAQKRLEALFEQPTHLTRMHTRAYNMLAYPWDTRYQQSNQWALETFAMAMEPDVESRKSAQAWLRLRHYTPTVLKIGALKRLGARITRANVAFDDQPVNARAANRVETVTADSVFVWMRDSESSSAVQTVR
jgi:hypothetical protein